LSDSTINTNGILTTQKEIAEIIKPFNYFKFIGRITSTECYQQCKMCHITVLDKREELVKHLKEIHGIEI